MLNGMPLLLFEYYSLHLKNVLMPFFRNFAEIIKTFPHETLFL